MRKVLLYFGNPTLHPKDVISFLHNRKIEYTIVSDENMNDIISQLLSSEQKDIITSNMYAFNFILYVGMTQDEVVQTIKEMQNENIYFSHKAMLTENNQHWNLKYLLEEMEEEYQFMLSWNKTQKLLKEANSLHFEEYCEETFIPYRDAILKAYMYIKQNKPEKAVLDALNQDIIDKKMALKKK